MEFVVRRFDSLDSTNRYLLDEARAGAPAGLVAVADHQTAGRGRRGRTWLAPPGASLLVSVLLRPQLPPGRAQLCTMAAGVALADPEGTAARYRDRLATLGRRVRVEQADGDLHGVARDLGPVGELLVERDDGELVAGVHGDVVHLRGA